MADKEEEYLWWLSHIINPAPNGRSYEFLIRKLYFTAFISKVERDENRLLDGMNLRDIYGIYVDAPCSILEMMIALAGRFDGNPGFDSDQARHNFWILIDNLGLNRFDDNGHFVYTKVYDILQTFVAREYDFDGKGGLFPLKNPKMDQTKVEIWDQMQEWQIENYGI